MSNSDENQDLQIYLKNVFKNENDKNDNTDLTVASESWKTMDAVTQKILQDDDEDDLDAADSISDTDDIVYYTESFQYSDNPKNKNKTIEIKLDDDSTDVLNIKEELVKENEAQIAEKLKVYDYNESVVIENENENENETKTAIVTTRHTLHIIKDVKNDDKLSCPHCSYSTNKRFLLTRHIKTHSNERPFKCSVCEREFKNNSALLNHTNSHLGKKPHHCKYCEMRFNTGGELARHVRYKHTHEKPHKCGECDYSSVELSKMRRHMRCHTGERPYQCPHCTYASPDTFKLKRHLRTHTGEKPYECDICNARFSQSNSLKLHKLIHSVGERPIFQCTLCPTTCGRKTDLQLHIQKLHTSDHPIKCKRCGKELPDRYTYKVHVKTHEGEKCYRCNICPYASISQRHLDMHMLIHTDEKPFSCEHCGMAFRQRQLLMRHNNIYHNKNYVPPTPQEKNHICPHCRRAFLRKGNLMRHMEMHDTRLTNNGKKNQLATGAQKVSTSADNSLILPIKLSAADHKDMADEVIDNNSSNGIGDEDGTDNCKIVETFEVIDNMTDVNADVKRKTLKCHLIYTNSDSKMKKTQTDAIVTSSMTLPNYDKREVKSETSTRLGSYFIVPSESDEARTALKKEHHLPIKIEIGGKDASDTDEANDSYFVIEVVEEEGMADDVVIDGAEANSNIAGDILEIPFQAEGKQEHMNAFGFVDDDEYVLPVEVPEED